MQIFKYKKSYTTIIKGITNISKTEVEIYRTYDIVCEMRLFLKDFKNFELLAVEVKLFQATAPLYEKDFLPKFVFGFGGIKLNSTCLVP